MSSPNVRPGSVSAHHHELPPVRALVHGSTRTVRFSGELDVASRAAVLDACVDGDHVDVRVDLSRVDFMDCAGYGALVAAKFDVERRGGSLVLANPSPVVQRLLTLIDALGRTAPTCRRESAGGR